MLKYHQLPHQSNSKPVVIFYNPHSHTYTVCVSSVEKDRAILTANRYPEYQVFEAVSTYRQLTALDSKGINISIQPKTLKSCN